MRIRPSSGPTSIETDPNYLRLSRKHDAYEARLAELRSRRFPTAEEQLEETTLKKLKLQVRDQMESIARAAGAISRPRD